MSDFVEFLCEHFAQFGPVQARKMFGGFGLYHDGVMFGLIAVETLYLKGDDATASLFAERGLEQFHYEKAGKIVRMSYWRAPEEIYDDPEEAAIWARRAHAAALSARSDANRSKKRRDPPPVL